MSLHYKLFLSFKSIRNVFPSATLQFVLFQILGEMFPPLLLRLLFELYYLSPPLGRIPHPLASGLRAHSSNGWWVKALKQNKVKWSEPGDGSGLFKGLSWVILQLLVALAEVMVWLCVAGSWAGVEGAEGPPTCLAPWCFIIWHFSLSVCLSLGRLAWASLQRGDWLPRGRR